MFRTDDTKRLILNEVLKDTLEKVQSTCNSEITYKDDKQIYGVPEKWGYPIFQVGKLVGDCEDLSLYKRKRLVELGVPKEPLLLTICLDPYSQGHCVLSVVTNKRDLILCNAHESVTTPSQMKVEGYRFLYRQGLGRSIDDSWDVLI